MAKDLNKVQMTGRLGADPEVRHTPQGHTVATFRVASNRSWRSSDGASHEETEWFRVVAWNRLAELCRKWLAKGARVYVEGRLQTRQWEDQEGQNRALTEVVASDMILLDRREQPAAPESEPANAPDHAPVPAALPRTDAPATTVTQSGEPRAAQLLQLPRGKRSFVEEDLPF